jgi:two-component system nitrate/nitrite response regulator NarL
MFSLNENRMALVTTPVRIMLVDDHPLVREGVRTCLDSVTGFLVENEASNASSALALLAHTHVDVVLVDIGLADSNGLDLIGQIGTEFPNVATVVLTMYANQEYVVRAIQEGAQGYVLKDSPVTEIVAAIHAVSAGGTFFSQQLVRFLRSTKQAPEEPTLTGRELEVLNEIVRGHSNKVIASTFDLSIRTVETHRKNIRCKVGAESMVDLLKYAARLGLLKF